MQINDEQVRVIIQESVSVAVKETLTSLGIDANDVIKTQAHMVAIREIAILFEDEDFKADLVHLRKWRKSMDLASSVTIKTVFGLIFTGGIGLLIMGLKGWIAK